MAIIFKLTNAGRAALVNAANNGTLARTVATIGVTATAFTPLPTLTAIPNETKRIATLSGDVVDPDTVHVTVRDDGPDTYSVRGFGLWLDNGVLLGTYSQPAVIVEKSAASIMLLAFDMRVLDDSVNIGTLQFGNADFLNPPATTERQGVVELATPAEAAALADATRALTPASVAALFGARALTSTTITAGTGLTGGGTLGANRTISLAATTVAAGSYGSATDVPTFTVDAQGRLTAAGSKPVTPAWVSITAKPETLAGYGITDAAPSARTITAGTGLTGGGSLAANRTIALANTTVGAGTYGAAANTPTFTVDAQGRLTAAGSVPTQAVKLATARKINGVDFDGGANIAVQWSSVSIPAAANLNDYQSEGVFDCTSNAFAATFLNSPTGKAFSLRVWKTAGVIQELVEYGSTAVSRMWRRHFFNNEWGSWYRVYSEADPQPSAATAGTADKLTTARKINGVDFDGSAAIVVPWAAVLIPNGTDLDVYKAEGLHFASSSSAAQTMLNCPSIYPFSLRVWNASVALQELVEYGALGRAKMWRRHFYNGAWLEWYRVYSELDPQPNTATATKLATARTFEITGMATAAAKSFDGSGNVQLIVASINLAHTGIAGLLGPDHGGMPTGTYLHNAGPTLPAGYLRANGAAVSRTTYADLFALLGTTYGAGNGSTTFNLPDARGMFLRSLDEGRGTDPSRALGSTQASQNLSHQHSGGTSAAGEHVHTGSTYWGGGHSHQMRRDVSGSGEPGRGIVDADQWSGYLPTAEGDGGHQHEFQTALAGSHGHAFETTWNGGAEARPVNLACSIFIKF